MNLRERGPKVVVARSQEGNKALRAMLADRGISAVMVETIKFDEPADWSGVDAAVKGMSGFDWLAFTSPRAVSSFGGRVRELGVQVGNRPRLAAVGAKTAAALEQFGLRAEFVPNEYLTSALGEGLPSGQGKKVLLLRADIGDRALVASLRRRGFDVTDVAIYRTRTAPGRLDPEEVKDARLVIFASPSEVRGFQRRLGRDAFRLVAEHATAACIGPVTADAARTAGFRSVVSSEEHTVDALVEKVGELMVHA